MPKPFYLTTTIPYVNAEPHIGFALEIVHADIIARYKKLAGFEVFFNTGTDEHGVKIYRKALENGKAPQVYVNEYAARYKELLVALDITPEVNFVRTTEPAHKEAAREFWRRCRANGFLEKKKYKVKYCVGCELEKTDSELERGRCRVHPNLELELIEEENWFFKLSAFTGYLSKLYERTDFVVPDFRLNELRSLIREKGLGDFSASRLASKLPWGIPVPDDPSQVMYVWFDAFVNYISAIGWPDDMKKFNKWWVESGGVVQFAGKDQVRQQAAMWQAMLKAAGIDRPSKQIVIHGFITSGGDKISKSLGNAIDPFAIVKEYGADVLRYYLARHVHPFEDSDFTMEKFKEAYNANLANGLGNLVSRVLRMSSKYNIIGDYERVDQEEKGDLVAGRHLFGLLDTYQINTMCERIWSSMEEAGRFLSIQGIDKYIQERQPFRIIKNDRKKAEDDIKYVAEETYRITWKLGPILPTTSQKIKKLFIQNTMPNEPLFPRKE